MKNIIMCGGQYDEWDAPRQLTVVNGETLVERTIRLLKENGEKDIAISSLDPRFERFGVPVLKHDNHYHYRGWDDEDGSWCDCFYPTDEPTCYLFGDVLFSPHAMRTIVITETKDIELFGSASPFADEYPKPWREPFALKVTDTDHLKRAIKICKQLDEDGKFFRKPIMWELWQVIKNTKLNHTVRNYTVINDYTCDIDGKDDVEKVIRVLK